MTAKRYEWATAGDVNAFFGLMLDNIAGLVLMVGLLSGVFAFPTRFALGHLVPGTAIGVLVGDLLFFWMAFGLARKTGNPRVTAMPLGLDTPSTFGMALLVLGPAFVAAKASGMSELEAATHTWHIGICSIFISGIFKSICALGSNWIRRMVPRAGLLGSLAAIALVLICFPPLIETLRHPIVGMVALAIILTTLIAHVKFPFRVPGALAALLVAGFIYYLMRSIGPGPNGLLGNLGEQALDPEDIHLLPTGWLSVFSFQWLSAMGSAMKYMPVVIPFALGTVVGGIDCTESAAAAGDDFNTNKVIGVEALATLIASVCGGVIQTTPYIGHPAYKAMGGRAAYTLATALFVGAAGVIGFFGYLYLVLPKSTVFPILVFIGIEITAQSFQVTPKRHYPAVAIACIPALAALVYIYVGRLLGETGTDLHSLSPDLRLDIETITVLRNGFIVTSMLWASALASIIDRSFNRAAIYFGIAAVCSFFGVMHSPLDEATLALPWTLAEGLQQYPYRFTLAYFMVAAGLVAWQSTGVVTPLEDHEPTGAEETDVDAQ